MINAHTVSHVTDAATAQIAAAADAAELEQLRVRFLGKKGELTLLMKGLKDVEAEQRKELGAFLNEAKRSVEALLSERLSALTSHAQLARLEAEWIDVTLPVRGVPVAFEPGSLHPLSRVQRELEKIFISLGFEVVDGPEVESEYYNFEALNIPSTHPARDMQDTIWTAGGGLLRTQTSAIQVRALEQRTAPLRIVAPGRCFRYERMDATHEHTFYQMEGMMVDRHVTVGHLIYFMKTLLREIFGAEQKIRLRPGYFPFVEPGFELDIWFRGRWLELLPCGLVHPKVLEYGGIDPSEWQGFAFGLGLSRLVMSRYQIDDIRHLQGGDLRFLKQFA
ncbi:MAG: phenylalanine--tRNA ligase subunit alpha [Bdellovibrionales bacterium]|nr:phenylalanine--tRNA ligase subunit alpha [Bdellovibrionales bacterium]